MNDTLPISPAVPRRRWSWWWLAPIVALLVVTALGVQALRARGDLVTLRFAQGHGLKPGDSLRHRGVQVGGVIAVALTTDTASVVVRVRLHPSARALARVGSRFWVVRPQLSLEGATGLDTLVGPLYLAVEPGDGRPARAFTGLEVAPVLGGLQLGGLEVVLDGPTRGGLRAGAPVTYRQMTVGRVISVALASDAGAVEARCYIEPAFATLVRERTRFWNASGFDLAGGLMGGVRLEIDSLQALIAGGIAFATPPDAGSPSVTGRRYDLHRRAEEDWLTWRPALALGAGPAAALPRPVRARLAWAAGRWWSGDDARDGWLVPVAGGVLALTDLVQPPPAARQGSGMLEANGIARAVADFAATPAGPGVVRVAFADLAAPAATAVALRTLTTGEDCLLVGDPAVPPRPLAAHTLSENYAIDDPGIDHTWHGAAAIARSDGALVALVAVDAKGHAHLLPITP